MADFYCAKLLFSLHLTFIHSTDVLRASTTYRPKSRSVVEKEKDNSDPFLMEFKFNCIETDIKHRECCQVHLLSGGVREGLSELVVCERGWEGGEECASGKSSDRAPGRQGPKCADRSVRGQCGGSPVTVGRRSRQRDQTNKQGLCGLL